MQRHWGRAGLFDSANQRLAAGHFLQSVGEPLEAEVHHRRAAELEPLNPGASAALAANLVAHAGARGAQHTAQRYQEAERLLLGALLVEGGVVAGVAGVSGGQSGDAAAGAVDSSDPIEPIADPEPLRYRPDKTALTNLGAVVLHYMQ
jgi:hypothetical protein